MPARPDPDNGFPFSAGGTDGFPFAAAGADGLPFKGKNESKTCGLIDFEHFQVVQGISPGSWFLRVGGVLKSISIRASLAPLYYASQPDYWQIEVVGCLPPIVLPAQGVFSETISVTDYMGTKGIEVVGLNRHEIWDLPE